ncbi:5-formyltetrahydrofolate cyclo-ligase [Falsochrobactrum shanghaiense]|uniref:5-formyltetrahydrofolate cyclo-ligase n=1 Tax=Falsochrobactrum shanghaiense TaxID=2201899 RepID=A0A316JCV9_9HYPH|nr:5-formyltetrahydrofolate cyclo-ligase [Falsochrobactrum shanghaiense]PWL16863.1 5-formyltetrahydrofolate cyclo-ligase [Falsochrobactrum shanghaiense]
MTQAGENRNDDKQALRREVLARRDALDPRYRYEASLRAAGQAETVITLPRGAMVAGYWPIRSEIDPRPLLSNWRTQGARLCLPVVIDRETIAFREFLPDADLVPTGFGTMGPDEDAPLAEPAIMLMPLAGFDERGHRLGYGAGHYDRALARFSAQGLQPLLIGMAFDCQEVAYVPNEPHDIALHRILTESGLRIFHQD